MEENNNQEQGMTVSAPAPQIITSISTNSTKLSELLMSNIEKLQGDPKFIPQAEAINAQVKTLIDLGKTELELLKLTAFMNHK